MTFQKAGTGNLLLGMAMAICAVGVVLAMVSPTVRGVVGSSDFIGAIAGTMLAIIGTIFLEDRKVAAEARRDREFLCSALAETSAALRQIADDLGEELPGGADLPRLRRDALNALDEVAKSVDLLDEAMGIARRLTFAELRALRHARRLLREHDAMFRHETEVVKKNYWAPRGVMEIYYRKAQPAAAELVSALDGAIGVLTGAPLRA